MHKELLTALAFSGFASTSAVGQEGEIYKVGLSPTFVSIMDGAEDGCWTNIGETKTYAEDQLELAGIRVVDDPKDAISRFSVSVNGKRSQQTNCSGSISFSVDAWATWRDQRLFVTLAQFGFGFVGHPNVNQIILENIKVTLREEIAGWPQDRP